MRIFDYVMFGIVIILCVLAFGGAFWAIIEDWIDRGTDVEPELTPDEILRCAGETDDHIRKRMERCFGEAKVRCGFTLGKNGCIACVRDPAHWMGDVHHCQECGQQWDRRVFGDGVSCWWAR